MHKYQVRTMLHLIAYWQLHRICNILTAWMLEVALVPWECLHCALAAFRRNSAKQKRIPLSDA